MKQLILNLLNGALWSNFGIKAEQGQCGEVFFFDKERGMDIFANIGYLTEINGEMLLAYENDMVYFPKEELNERLEIFLYTYFFGVPKIC